MKKVMDTVLPEPKTELGLHLRWQNNLLSELISKVTYDRKIEVNHLVDCRACGGTALVEDDMCRNCKQESYCE